MKIWVTWKDGRMTREHSTILDTKAMKLIASWSWANETEFAPL